MTDPRNYGVIGAPLKFLTWCPETQKVRIAFRDGTDFDTKLAFLQDLQRQAARAFMVISKNPPAGWKGKEIDWEAVARLPKPTMTGDEVIAVFRGDD